MARKLPSLADMLKQSNDSSTGNETGQKSLGDLLKMSITQNDQSGMVGNTKPTGSPSLADLMASATKNNTTRNTNELSPLRTSNTNTPSLTDLLKSNTLQGGCVGKKDTSLTSLLSPNTSSASSIPSLSDILKNSPDRSVTKPMNKVPDLSTLLNQVNINNAAKKENAFSLSASIGKVTLSDLADQFADKESSCSISTTEAVTSKTKLKYMNRPSQFGKIFGAKLRKRDNRSYRRWQEFKKVDFSIIFTKEMLGKKGLVNVYEFNDPSPDDRVKAIQDKAFERK